MKAKIQILTAVLILGCRFCTLYAQPREHRPPVIPDSSHIVQQVEDLAAALSLSDQQKTEILNLHFQHFKQIKRMLENEKAHHENVRKAHDQLKAEFDASVLRLLTDEQKSEFEAFCRTHQPPRHAPHENFHPGQMNSE